MHMWAYRDAAMGVDWCYTDCAFSDNQYWAIGAVA